MIETAINNLMKAKKLKPCGVVSVLHIIKSLGRGGAETLLPETLANHDKNKFDFHYIYFLPWKFQMVKEIENAGGTVNCFTAKNNVQIFSKIFQIVNYIKTHNIKLIHCHLPWAGIVGRIAGKITNVPVVYTEHNKWERYHKLTFQMNKWSFSKQERVIAVSKDVAYSIKKFYKKNYPVIEVVSNGINIEKFFNKIPLGKDIRKEMHIPQDAIVIGITCVFRVQKRLTTWLEIAKRIQIRFPETHFLIVGDGVLKEEVFEKANELNFGDCLHFAGLQSEIRPYLKAMNIFMMSSEFEGLPIALLEAMSMECMPACTAAGGIPELITDGENGILVPVDEPLRLADRVIQQLEEPLQISLKGAKARETVERNFSMKKMVGELETIYHDLLNSRH